MFGKNEIAKPREIGTGFSLHSIWYTIQGEGPWAGKPALFVRLAGCNLRCFWCDTDFSEKRLYDAQELATEIKVACAKYRCGHVVITGGEPLLQPLPDLFVHFDNTLLRFQIETAGTVWPEGLGRYVTGSLAGEAGKALLVVSPKTGRVAPQAGHRAGAWKYIVSAADAEHMRKLSSDGLPLMSTQRPGVEAEICRPMNSAPVYVQPLDEGGGEISLINAKAAAEIAMAKGYHLSLQMHKIVGVE